MKFIEKLRNLSEPKKIAIFFTVMGAAALVVGFVGMRFIVHDLSKAKDSLESAQMPNINLNLPDIEFPDVNLENVSESNQEIITTPN